MCFVVINICERQVKEVEKGQECGLGLDVKFEVLQVRSKRCCVLHLWHTSHSTRHTSHLVTRSHQNDIMEAVAHSSRLHTIEEVWGDGR